MVNPTPFFVPDYSATRDVTLPRLQKFARGVIQRFLLDSPGQLFDVLVHDLHLDDLTDAVKLVAA
jgi:hypothetical protein